jgi:acetaldehyde dehydrogenase (acetylating)
MNLNNKNFRVAILGSGNIGTDLMMKVQKSKYLKCEAFIGRSNNSRGMMKAIESNIKVSDKSIQYIIENSDDIDLVFDATSAKDHLVHSKILKKLGVRCIDLTPAKVGPMCVPSVNAKECLSEMNINMISCGGQASIPIAKAIANTHKDVDYIEVVSSIASKSAGPATRRNLDEYIKTTSEGLKYFSGAKKTKSILNLNPAIPHINMVTTILAKVKKPNIKILEKEVTKFVSKVNDYVPGYELIFGPRLENDRIVIILKVRGLGDYLPKYAGNLDIINSAAIAMAEEYSKNKINEN